MCARTFCDALTHNLTKTAIVWQSMYSICHTKLGWWNLYLSILGLFSSEKFGKMAL
jgi:hypothetical protein